MSKIKEIMTNSRFYLRNVAKIGVTYLAESRNLRKVTMIAFLVVSSMFVACNKDKDALTMPNEQEKTQTAYADETNTGKGFTFTAKGNWTATVKEVKSQKSGSGVEWLKLLLNGKETYSGSAGTFTMVIELETNATGTDRSAIITVTCKDVDVAINVTQMANSSTPTLKLVSRITLSEYGRTADFTYDAQNRLSSIDFVGQTIVPITYPTANTMRAVYEGEEWGYNLNNDGYITNMFVDGENLGALEYENGYLKKIVNDIYTWEDGNLKSISGGYSMTYTYSTIPYKAISIAPFLVTPWMDDELHGFFPSVCFGKKSKYLVASETYNGQRTDYRYELDANGYVTKIYKKIDGGTEKLLCEIKYK